MLLYIWNIILWVYLMKRELLIFLNETVDLYFTMKIFFFISKNERIQLCLHSKLNISVSETYCIVLITYYNYYYLI